MLLPNSNLPIVHSIAALLALGFMLTASAQDPASSGAVAQGVPALKVTTAEGHKGILIGTVHVGVQGLREPDARIFDGATKHIVEQSSEPTASQAGQGKMPVRNPWMPAIMQFTKTGQYGRAPWAAELKEGDLAEMKRRAICALPSLTSEAAAMVAVMSLAMASPLTAEDLATRPCADPGSTSRDELLAGYATARGLPTVALEAAAEIESRRQNVPDHIHLNNLRVALSDRQKPAIAAIVEALNVGDFDQVYQVTMSLAANADDAAEYERLMLADRNEAWVPRLISYLADGDAVISVGAAHLSGPHGLATLLRRAGLKVEPIVVPQAPRSP